MRSQAFSVGMGNAPTDVTPPKPAPTPTESSAPSSTGGYSPMAAYASPGAFGLTQIGNAIGDTVSKYVTPVVKTVGDTFLGVDDFRRVPGKVREGDWAGAAKSLGTGVTEAGTTVFGGDLIRAGGKGLAFAAGKLGKYVPELETAAETGGRFITGTKQRAIGASLALAHVFTPITHTVGEAIKHPTSVSQVIGGTSDLAKGALKGAPRTVEGAKSIVPALEDTAKKAAQEKVDYGKAAVNAAKASFHINSDAPDQAPATVVRPYKQQQQQQGTTTDGDTTPIKPAKKPTKPKKPKDFNFDMNIPGQNAQITAVN